MFVVYLLLLFICYALFVFIFISPLRLQRAIVEFNASIPYIRGDYNTCIILFCTLIMLYNIERGVFPDY